MNLPNLLTLLRIFFVPLLVAALLADDLGGSAVSVFFTGLNVSREVFALGVFAAEIGRAHV